MGEMAEDLAPLIAEDFARQSLREWASKTEIQDWLHLRQFRLLKKYVTDGRRYRHLPIDELRSTWIDIYRKNTKQPEPQLAQQECELDSEFLLRHAPLPLQVVRKEMMLRIDAAVADVKLHCQAEPRHVLETIPGASHSRHGH